MNNLNIRKILIIFIGVIIVITALFVGLNFLTTGSVTILTGKQAEVVITNTNTNKEVAHHKGINFSTRLKGGNYIARVKVDSDESDQFFTVHNRNSQTLTLNPSGYQKAQHAISFTTANLIFNPANNSLNAFDISSNRVFQLTDGQVRPQLLFSQLTKISGVWWFDPSTALVIANGKAYTNHGGSTQTLDIGINLNAQVVGAVNVARHQLVVGIAKKIYLYNLGETKPKATFTTNFSSYQLSLTNDNLIVTPVGDNASRQVDVYKLADNTKQTYNISARSLLVSPGGDKVLCLCDGITKIMSQDLQQTLNVLPTTSQVYAWQDNNTVIYGEGNGIFHYDPNGVAKKISSGNGTVTAVAASSDGTRFYFASSNGVIYGVSTTGGADTTLLENNLPTQTNHYKIDFNDINLGKPVIVVTTFAVFNTPDQFAQAQKQNLAYRTEALQYLSDKKIDVSNYSIVYIPN